MTKEKKTHTYHAGYGMQVFHERTVDWKRLTISHHIEISVPGYELTSNGPEIISPKKQELANDTE